MSHECPECGSLCFCGGDIDDCQNDLPGFVNACTCCPIDGEDWEDFEDWNDVDYLPEPEDGGK